MIFRKTKNLLYTDKIYSKARKRIQFQDIPSLIDYIDTIGSPMASHATSYRRTREIADITELRIAAMSIVAICDNITERTLVK